MLTMTNSISDDYLITNAKMHKCKTDFSPSNLTFFCHYPFSIIFLALFLSFFSALLPSLPFSLHILSGCCKKLGVNYGQSLEMDLDQLQAQWTILPPFLHQNCQHHFSICYLRIWSISQIDCCTKRSIPALSSANKEHLVTFKLMTAQVVQRATP